MNFKRVIWHDSFYELVDSIHAVSKTGLYITCADGITRHLYPVILILSADYEEQYEFYVLHTYLCLYFNKVFYGTYPGWGQQLPMSYLFGPKDQAV